MDLLPLHIEYLLTRHDCVIVPGLGAFIATERESHIDLERGVISPRRREISFNSSVVTDDGLLTHSIARREGLAYEEARRIVGLNAERMTADLDNEGEVSVGLTGKLIKDDEGLISFQPRVSSVLSDIMGDVTLTEAMPAAAGALAEPESTAIKEVAEEEDGMRTIRVKADRYVFTVSKRAVHAAAMLVAILTIGLSLLLPINHDNEQKASVISIEDIFRRPVKSEPMHIKESDALKTQAPDSVAATDIAAPH